MEIKTGGTWSAVNKREVFSAVDAVIGQHFVSGDSGRIEHAGARLEAILSSAVTEQSAFEIKQGFLRLDDGRAFDDAALEKAIRTATAIANRGPRAVGYLIFGVADEQRDAERVKQLWGTEAVAFRDFYVTGTDHELLHLGKSRDMFLSELEARIRSLSVPAWFVDDLLRNLQPVRARRPHGVATRDQRLG